MKKEKYFTVEKLKEKLEELIMVERNCTSKGE